MRYYQLLYYVKRRMHEMSGIGLVNASQQGVRSPWFGWGIIHGVGKPDYSLGLAIISAFTL